MSAGKYSPTIQSAYKKDPNWFEKYVDPENPVYDKDGFDQYGYDRNGVDRAGHTEYDYQSAEIHNDGDGTLMLDVFMMFLNYTPIEGGE